MKVITQETLYMKNMVLLWSTIYETCYIMVLLWSTSVEKRIVTLPLFVFFWPSFFSLAFFGGDNALLNDDHHTSIYLQLNDYNSILKQGMTLYDGGIPGYAMNQEWQVWKNYERWLCHKYYINYMIMLSNMTMMNVSWWSRYDGDVSTPPSLNPCLSSSNSVDKLKEKEKLLQTLFALVVVNM